MDNICILCYSWTLNISSQSLITSKISADQNNLKASGNSTAGVQCSKTSFKHSLAAIACFTTTLITLEPAWFLVCILKLSCHSAAAQDKQQDHIHSNGGLWQPQNSSCGCCLILMPSYSKLAANCKLLLWARQVFFHHLTVYAYERNKGRHEFSLEVLLLITIILMKLVQWN